MRTVSLPRCMTAVTRCSRGAGQDRVVSFRRSQTRVGDRTAAHSRPWRPQSAQMPSIPIWQPDWPHPTTWRRRVSCLDTLDLLPDVPSAPRGRMDIEAGVSPMLWEGQTVPRWRPRACRTPQPGRILRLPHQVIMSDAGAFHSGGQRGRVEQVRRKALLIYSGEPDDLCLFNRPVRNSLGRGDNEVTYAAPLHRSGIIENRARFGCNPDLETGWASLTGRRVAPAHRQPRTIAPSGRRWTRSH